MIGETWMHANLNKNMSQYSQYKKAFSNFINYQ